VVNVKGESLILVRAGEMERREISEQEVLEEIRRCAEDTGGFCLQLEQEIPQYVTIAHGSRPGSSFDYRIEEALVTDGELEHVSRKRLYNYPTQDDCIHKYKITSASFAIKICQYGNDYGGKWLERVDITVYGNCPFLSKLKDLQKELEI